MVTGESAEGGEGVEKGRKKIVGEKKEGEMGANKVLWEWMREGRTGRVRHGEEGKSSQ